MVDTRPNAALFERDKSTVSRHIKNVFEEGELERPAVIAIFATNASDGKTYNVDYYNLDVIISVGYHVKSLRGTQFRKWATGRLNEYIRKGLTMDDERLKNGGGRYFRELLGNRREVLKGKGRISHKQAVKKAEAEFYLYRTREMAQLVSDFDRTVKQLTQKDIHEET